MSQNPKILAPSISVTVDDSVLENQRLNDFASSASSQRRHSSWNTQEESTPQNLGGGGLLSPLQGAFSKFSFLKRSLTDLAKTTDDSDVMRTSTISDNIMTRRSERGSQDDLSLLGKQKNMNNLTVPFKPEENIFAKGGLKAASVSTEILNKIGSQPRPLTAGFDPASYRASFDRHTPHFK